MTNLEQAETANDAESGERTPGSARILGSADLRRHNLSAVLRTIVTEGRCARAELARRTGLTKTAMGGLVAELLARGVVVEEGVQARGVGRPSAPLRLASERFATAVIELGASLLESTVCDLAGQVLLRATDESPLDGGQRALDLVVQRAREAQEAVHQRGLSLVGIVLAVRGIVDPDSGKVLYVPWFDWEGFDLADHVVRSLREPSPLVVVERASNLAALGDWERHGRDGGMSLATISTSAGAAAGFIVDGRLYRGSHGYVGLGHMVLDPNGPICDCGNRGCWSSLIGIGTVLREALPEVAASLERIPGYERAALQAILAAARSGDEQTVGALERAGTWLGLGAVNIANMLDTDLIVVGGYAASVGEWMLPRARDVFAERCPRPGDPEDMLIPSELGDERVFRGGVEAMRTQLIEDPVSAPNAAAVEAL